MNAAKNVCTVELILVGNFLTLNQDHEFLFYQKYLNICSKVLTYCIFLISLRGFECRSEMKFHSMTPCKYRTNKYVTAGNERSSATLTRARIKSILNFQPLYSLAQ